MKTILIKVGLLISMLVNANLLFSQSGEYSEDGGFAQFNLGFGTEIYNNKSKASAFSMEIGAGYGRIGVFLDMNINESPKINTYTKDYIDLKNCSIWDYKLLMHFYPFKVKRVFTPYIQAGPGYSYVERKGETYVAYNDPLYNVTAREKIGNYFITQVGAGILIVAFKQLAINVEYSNSFFRNPDYLNGQQIMIRLGWHGWLD